MFNYLVSDEEVMENNGDQLNEYLSKINELVEANDKDGLDKYENLLLNDFGAVKLRIDIVRFEDKYYKDSDNDELYRLRCYMSAVNMALLKIVEMNPDSRLSKYLHMSE